MKKPNNKRNEMEKNAKTKAQWVIAGHGYYGLMYGQASAAQLKQWPKTKAIHLTNCRNIRYWFCRLNGGITSLALVGPSGSRVSQCRIGAANPLGSTVVEVKAVHLCAGEAVAAFDATPAVAA